MQSGLFRTRTSDRPSFDVVASNASVVSMSPSFYGFDQPDPITITFAGPVQKVTVVGSGAISCTGNPGVLTGYDASGAVVGSQPLQIIDPTDCSPDQNPDNVTFGAQATLVTTKVMQTAVISGLSPLAFPVFDLVGHATQRYKVSVGTGPGALTVTCTPASPTRGDDVTCTGTVTPTQPFVITERRSEGTGYLYVSTDRQESDGAPYEWKGKAAIDARVTLTAALKQGTTETALAPASASFTVTARIGAQWTNLRTQPTAPTEEPTSGAPLLATPFTTGSLAFADGAIGQYEQNMRFSWQTIISGPNTNLIYTRAPVVLDPSRMYSHAWLYRNSSFYRAQVGNPNQVMGQRPCTGADIDVLRNNTIEHEKKHFSEDKAFFETHDVQMKVEAAFAPVDASVMLTENPVQADVDRVLKAAQDQALDNAYKRDWTAIVKTAVDKNFPVRTPGCKPTIL